jgi:N6-L-threonylcarbamoyladenine synthase
MKILALETSCDETACAIVNDGREVLASVVRSQIETHTATGGVVPEVAAREHLLYVNDVVDEALSQAGLSLGQVDAFAATLGPGLVGALLAGATTAKTLSLALDKPFLGVHHLRGHIASVYLDSNLEPPFLCLLVSGGHTLLTHVQSYRDMYIVGQSLDDAVGECFDKSARLMGLGYPGGPAVERQALLGDATRHKLPVAKTEQPFDFSFSGLKTAVLRLWQQAETLGDRQLLIQDVCASLQATITKTLLDKTSACAASLGVSTVVVVGGVAANVAIRQGFQDWSSHGPSRRVVFPPLAYCMDNAAMIASAAYYCPLTDDLSQDVFPRGPL